MIRHKLFGGKLRQGCVDTIETILAECKKKQLHDLRQIAYIFATAYHESYNTLQNPDWHPVREGFTDTNQEAINHVTKLYHDKRIKKNYALPAKNGKSYYGRGWVQITLPDNYTRLGDYYGLDLYNNPDLALERKVAAILLVDGMIKGWYTGHKLSTYITESFTDFEGARRIINGQDKADLIEDYAKRFYTGLIQL